MSGITIGAKYIHSFNMVDKEIYHGFNCSAGIGASIPIDMYGELTRTLTVSKINVYDIMDKVYIKIMEW